MPALVSGNTHAPSGDEAFIAHDGLRCGFCTPGRPTMVALLCFFSLSEPQIVKLTDDAAMNKYLSSADGTVSWIISE
jgi:aerobic-type carbon monoxide dehydrogenase small subunit (CoxS/CutS family)